MRLRSITVFDAQSGREYTPAIRDMRPDVSDALKAWLKHQDLGLSRVIGMINKQIWDPRTQQKSIGVALVETGDPDGCEWREWVPIPSDAEEIGNRIIAELASQRIEKIALEKAITPQNQPAVDSSKLSPMLDHEGIWDQDNNFLGEQGWMVD